MLQELFDGRGHLLRGGGEAEFDLDDVILKAQEVLFSCNALIAELPGGLGFGNGGDGLISSKKDGVFPHFFLGHVQERIEPRGPDRIFQIPGRVIALPAVTAQLDIALGVPKEKGTAFLQMVGVVRFWYEHQVIHVKGHLVVVDGIVNGAPVVFVVGIILPPGGKVKDKSPDQAHQQDQSGAIGQYVGPAAAGGGKELPLPGGGFGPPAPAVISSEFPKIYGKKNSEDQNRQQIKI